jgi:sporulation protein YunB
MPKSIIISGGSASEANTRRFKKRKKLRFIYRLLIFLLVLSCVFLALLKYSESRLRPIIASMAEAHARSIGARVVGETIDEEIAQSSLTYDDLISFEKAENGKISALKTNILTVNRLKSKLSVVILNKLSGMADINLYIPVGNLLNGEFLSGRGPRIEVILIPVGSVVTDIRNVFSSAGINQTRHQIMLDVQVTVSIIMPFSVETTDILTSVSIAETIIVGDVPNMYMEAGAGEAPNIAVSPGN